MSLPSDDWGCFIPSAWEFRSHPMFVFSLSLSSGGLWRAQPPCLKLEHPRGVLFTPSVLGGRRLGLPPVGVGLKLHPCFASSPFQSCVPHPFPVSPGSTSLINLLHTNPCLRICLGSAKVNVTTVNKGVYSSSLCVYFMTSKSNNYEMA